MPSSLTDIIKKGIGGLKNGLFNGGAVNQTFLPWNDIIRTYNFDKDSLFRVRINAYSQTAPSLSVGPSGPQVTTIADPSPIWQCELLHNEDSLTISHDQNYGDIGGLVGEGLQLFDKGIMGVGGVDVLRGLQSVKNLASGTNVSSTIPPFRSEWNDFASVDIAKAYKGTSNPQNFSTSFILFADKDPFMDVVVPSVIFAYLSYPAIDKTKSVKELLSSFGNAVEGAGGKLGKSISSAFGKLDEGVAGPNTEIAEKAGEYVKDASTIIKDLVTGVIKDRWRVRIGNPPPYWTVSSSNGIIFLNNAHLKEVSITYHGPWLKPGAKAAGIAGLAEKLTGKGGMLGGAGGDLSSAAGDIFGGATGGSISVLGGGAKEGISSLLGKMAGGGGGSNLSGFPSYAEVKLTFVSNFSQVFAEEMLMGLVGANAQFGNRITNSITGLASKFL